MKLDKSSYVSGAVEVAVPNGDGTLTLFVNEIGYLESLRILTSADGNDKGRLAALVAESVTDKDGNKFTIDEVNRLRRAVAQPLFEAVVKLNGIRGPEKN